jgi:hypothetical protein
MSSMQVSVGGCMYVCVFVGMYACMYACKCMYVHAHIRAYVMYVHACMRAYVMYVHACMRAYVCMCMDVCVTANGRATRGIRGGDDEWGVVANGQATRGPTRSGNNNQNNRSNK